jgi:hypothetical protein
MTRLCAAELTYISAIVADVIAIYYRFMVFRHIAVRHYSIIVILCG